MRRLLGVAPLLLLALLAAGCGTGGIAKGGDVSRGKQLFVSKCGSCHTLADAGTTGTVGPNLDNAFAADRAQGFPDSSIQQVVADQIKYPFTNGTMPPNLVTGSDVDAVARYVASVAAKAAAGTTTAPGTSAQTTTAQTTTATAPTTTQAQPAQTQTAQTTTGGAPAAAQVKKGEQLYSSLGCQSCHSLDGSSGVGPTFKGLAGSQVQLSSGQTVTADDQYLLDSIESPDKQIVKGYQPGIMSGVVKPGSVAKADAEALVAFIKAQK